MRSPAAQRESRAAMPEAGAKKILVVDDEKDIADLTVALLDCHGFGTSVAYSAEEALQILAGDASIDAVFSDVTMPGLTGLQLADAVSDSYPAVRIVLTSGFGSPGILLACKQRYLFIAKPYGIDAVVSLFRGDPAACQATAADQPVT
ncbi:MAG TPA: response regulator [Pseudoduganella sp.]|jgi:DNA-binding NtrC family response regulator